MKQEKLEQLKFTLQMAKKMVDDDLAMTIFDREGVVLYFQAAESFQLHFEVGYQLENKNDKVFEVVKTGKAIHDALPKEVFGVAIEGNLIPIFEGREIIGVVTCVFSVDKKNSIERQAFEMNESLDETKDSIFDISKGALHLADELNNIQQIMKVVETNVNEVTAVVNSIQSNASRSNILALNASIEAARAGDSGKGFAIVASEMGKLAKLSSDSSKEIDKALSGMVSSIEEVRKAINESNDVANNQTSAVKKITGTLEELVKSTQFISQIISK